MMGGEEPTSLLQGFTLLGMGLSGLSVVLWGHRGAVGAYLGGLLLCVLGWGASVMLVGRLGGAAPDPLPAALGANFGVVLSLAIYWLVVASGGILIGAFARVLLLRYRRRHPKVH